VTFITGHSDSSSYSVSLEFPHSVHSSFVVQPSANQPGFTLSVMAPSITEMKPGPIDGRVRFKGSEHDRRPC
jgi:hypothetical protein